MSHNWLHIPGCKVLNENELWRMQGISSTDIRSEVRNCAVRTLFAVVVSQGNRMSSELWDECLWEILFPLLRSVHHMSVTSSREEVCQHLLSMGEVC